MSNSTNFVDFSFANKTYAKFRDNAEIQRQLNRDVFLIIFKGTSRDLAIDVGAGTGQASLPLTKYFKKVIAFDPSPGQLEQTSQRENLEFRQSTAEKIDLPDHSVDLIVSAQAAHWFDLPKFFAESQRLLKPNGLLAIWCYSVCTLDNPEATKLVRTFYEKVRPFFHPNRQLIDDQYKTIVPTFGEVERVDSQMSKNTVLPSFIGYLSTWSGLNEYSKQNPSENLLATIEKDLGNIVGKESDFQIHFPLSIIYVQNKN